jgi:TfoX/Sxy family transcriptional regulator of competence genes
MDGQGFKDQLLDRLSLLGDISSGAMFGGHGLEWRGVIFAITHRRSSTCPPA